MIVTLKFEDWEEQQFVYDLLHISTIPPGNYILVNNCNELEVLGSPEKLRREISIEADESFDFITISEIMKLWYKHYPQTINKE